MLASDEQALSLQLPNEPFEDVENEFDFDAIEPNSPRSTVLYGCQAQSSSSSYPSPSSRYVPRPRGSRSPVVATPRRASVASPLLSVMEDDSLSSDDELSQDALSSRKHSDFSVDGLTLEVPERETSSSTGSMLLSSLSPSPRFGLKKSESFVSISRNINFQNGNIDRFAQYKISGSPRIKDLLNSMDRNRMEDAYPIIKEIYDQKKLSPYLIKELKIRGFDGFEVDYLELMTLQELNKLYGRISKNPNTCMSKLTKVAGVIKNKQAEQAQK
ncbi:MAG: hypothetical protein Q8Q60_04385 [Candidatus Chromulinivorax sp.]|nr:hypothetical protein [Candidatus Chromulinivorax sp.]